MANFFRKTGHFGVPAGVVGDRAVSVGRERNAEGREHPDRRDADAVKTERERLNVREVETGRAAERENRRDADDDDRRPNAEHTFGDTGDNDRRRARFALARDALRRFVFVRGAVFRPLADQPTGEQTDDDRNARELRRPRKERHRNENRENRDNNRRHIDALAERLQERALVGFFVRANEENAVNRENDPDRRQKNRQEERAHLRRNRRVHRSVSGDAERGARKNRTAVRFVQVGAHPRDVADVVADVVRDGGRVAAVVFRNPGFDFTDQVGADVRGLRVDAAADASEQRLRRGAHPEAEHNDRNFRQVHRPVEHRENPVQRAEPKNDVEKTEADDRQPHNRARTERDLQTFVQRFLSARRGARRSPSRRFHPEPTGQTGEETAGQERPRNDLVLNARAPSQVHQERPNDDEENRDDFILLLQIRVGALANRRRDLDHFFVPFVGLHHRLEELDRENKRGDRTGQRKNPKEPEEAEERSALRTLFGLRGVGLRFAFRRDGLRGVGLRSFGFGIFNGDRRRSVILRETRNDVGRPESERRREKRRRKPDRKTIVDFHYRKPPLNFRYFPT